MQQRFCYTMEKERKFLSDILIAIELIEDFTIDIQDFIEYNSDRKTQSAVERQLGIIGEALNQLRKENALVNITYYQQIIGFRNRLIHAYDSIDNSIVWAILHRHLPNLKKEIQKKIWSN